MKCFCVWFQYQNININIKIKAKNYCLWSKGYLLKVILVILYFSMHPLQFWLSFVSIFLVLAKVQLRNVWWEPIKIWPCVLFESISLFLGIWVVVNHFAAIYSKYFLSRTYYLLSRIYFTFENRLFQNIFYIIPE